MSATDTFLYYLSVVTLLYVVGGVIIFILLLPVLHSLADITLHHDDKRRAIARLTRAGMFRVVAADLFMSVFPVHWKIFLAYVFQKDL